MSVVSLSLKVVGGIVITAIVTVGVIIATVDPNDYRNEITELVKKETGRDLQIQSLSLSFFPRFGLNLENTTLSNAQGFSKQDFVHIQNVQVGAAILPLLSQKLEVDTLTLHGLTLNLEKKADGQTNWDDLIQSSETPQEKKEPSPSTHPLEKLADLEFGGLDIQNSQLNWQDHSANQTVNLSIHNFSTSRITFGQFFNLTLNAETTLSNPEIKALLELSIETKLEQNGTYAVRNLVLKTSATGKGLPVEQVNQTLSIPTISLNENTLNLPKLSLEYDVTGGEAFPLKTINGQLQVSALEGNLATQAFKAQTLQLQSDITGEAIPNGKMQLSLTTQPGIDLTQQTAQLTQLVFNAMGIKATGSVHATQLTSNPIINTQLKLPKTNLRQQFEQLGVALPEMADNATLTQFSASLKARFENKTQTVAIRDLNLNLDDSSLSGTASISQFDSPNIQYNLTLDTLDLNRYLPPPTPPIETPPSKEKKDVKITLPVELLRKLTLNGRFIAKQITYDKLHPKNLAITIKGHNGKITANPIKVDLFNTTLHAQAGVDVSGKTQQFSVKLDGKNIPIGEVLMAVADTDKLRGTGSLNVNVTTSGNTLTQFKQNLNGTTATNLTDGSIKGFNLAQSIREAQAKMSGKPVPPNKEELKTDFSSLVAQLSIKQGIITTQKLSAKAPFMRISGSGSINLPKESLNYLVRTKIVASDKGEGGKNIQELNGLTIPVKLKGHYLSPKVSLDISALLEEKTKAELEKKKDEVVKEATKKVEEQLKDTLLKGFKF